MYDFTTLPERRHTMSEKWHLIEEDMTGDTDDVMALSVADMEFVTAPFIQQALVQAAQNDILGYDYVGEQYLNEVISWFQRRHNINIVSSWIRTSDGVMPAINAALRAFTHPGDSVIIQTPAYPPFVQATRNNGLTMVENPLVQGSDGTYRMNFKELEALAQDSQCTAMIVCNPHNPVGRVWEKEELEHVAEICIRNNVIILSDAIHADFTYPSHQMTFMHTLSQDTAQHVIEFTAPTKTFNMAGLLCSNVIIPNPILRQRFDAACQRVGGLTVSHFGLVATMAAYREGQAWLDELMKVLEDNLALIRRFVLQHKEIKLVEPEGTYLVWLDFRELGFANSDELRDFLRYKARVYLDEGAIFGTVGQGFERINIACPTSFLARALERISNALASRNKVN